MGVQNNDHKEENELQPHFLFLLECKSLNMYVCLLVYLTVEVTPGYNGPSGGAEEGAVACRGGPKDREEDPARTSLLLLLAQWPPLCSRDGSSIPFWDRFS